MNTKYVARLTVISLVVVLSQLAGREQVPQFKQNDTLNNLSERSYPSESNKQKILFMPLGEGSPSYSVGAGSR